MRALGALSIHPLQENMMPKFAEMDEKVTLFAQMEDQGGPVVLINKLGPK